MDPIRVIGRIDLAHQVHAALVAAGADARLATAAPGAVLKETGRDGTGIDVLANGFDLCPSIKKAAPTRPVVLVTFDEAGAPPAAAYGAQMARTSRGPDAHLPWPATGVEILAACDRAREVAASVSRPRISARSVVVTAAAIAAAAAWVSVFQILPYARGSTSTQLLAALAQAAVLAGVAWWSARRAPANAAQRFWRVAQWWTFLLVAALTLANALLRLRLG
ncbi:MAG TPA: hypothetical protein VLT47_07050 [Anaeromyxobacteraceae bacterium]|nr:hypothetical protein [Anaeromyxobacteraceae bacterium]